MGAFAGANDEWEDETGTDMFGLKPDWEDYKRDPGRWDPNKGRVRSPYRHSRNSQVTFRVTEHHAKDYESHVRNSTKWADWISMLDSAECENMYAIGYSNGGGTAQLYFASQADGKLSEDGEYFE